MRRYFIIAMVAFFVFGLVNGAMAVGSGKKIEYDEKTTGTVIFDGKSHADAGAKCADCHSESKLFGFEKSRLNMADMQAGKSCGACHIGERVFNITECAKCHKK
jgi:c(7)-type cytochrome triheme protein